LVWEYFRSWRKLARELEARARAIEQRNPDSIAAAIEAGELRSVVEKVREFNRRYFDELNICLGYVLYRFYDTRMRTKHYTVKAMVLRTDGPDPEIDFVDVEWWLKEHSETS
jgi:hypothetical protein